MDDNNDLNNNNVTQFQILNLFLKEIVKRDKFKITAAIYNCLVILEKSLGILSLSVTFC